MVVKKTGYMYLNDGYNGKSGREPGEMPHFIKNCSLVSEKSFMQENPPSNFMKGEDMPGSSTLNPCI